MRVLGSQRAAGGYLDPGAQPGAEGLRCQASEPQGDTVFVACAGKIVTSYDGERREFDLAERQFRLVAEAGEWRMCGYR